MGPVVDVNGNVTNPIPGQYYDLGKNNTLSNTDPNSLTPVTPNQVRWLVPYGPQGQFLHQEIGRNSYQTPGTTTHLLALEKGIGLSYLHLERGVLLLRAEAQNVFNHNDGAQPSTDVLNTDVGFLSPIRTGSNRTLVSGLSFSSSRRLQLLTERAPRKGCPFCLLPVIFKSLTELYQTYGPSNAFGVEARSASGYTHRYTVPLDRHT